MSLLVHSTHHITSHVYTVFTFQNIVLLSSTAKLASEIGSVVNAAML